VVQEIDKSETQLSKLIKDLKVVRQEIASLNVVLPNLITSIAINVNEIKIIRDQLEEFTNKKQNLMQKLVRLL
jgi:chromosome segregation ATPase